MFTTTVHFLDVDSVSYRGSLQQLRASGSLVAMMPDLPRIDVGENKQEMFMVVSYSESVVSGTRSGSNDRTMRYYTAYYTAWWTGGSGARDLRRRQS